MAEWGWEALDLRVRELKRALFAGTRRRVKRSRRGMEDTGLALVNLARRVWRRALVVPGRARQQMRRLEKSRKKLGAYRAEWRIEREVAAAVGGAGPILVGPWLSEVGYEVLYWVPFVRWVKTRYDVDPDRFVVVTRGGAAAWYADFAARRVEIFDLMDPAVFAARNEARGAASTGSLKQYVVSDMDREILEQAKARIDAPDARVLHPSVLYRLFYQFWLGHRPQGFYDSRTRHARIAAPDVPLPAGLPPRYVAAKFYSAMSLPATPAVRRLLQSLVLAIAEKTPVVMLDTGLTFDDHEDHTLEAAARIHTLRGRLAPRDNLAVQTAVIARSESFVGTCGALAWLAPMLGVDTTAVMTDPKFLHHHLQVARRVYQNIEGAGRFSVLDLGAFEQLGIMPSLYSSVREPTA